MIGKRRAKHLRLLIEKTAVNLTDEEAITGVELFPKWSEAASYQTGDRVRYDDILYKCLQSHNSQSSWTPPDAPSLWVRIDDPSVEFPEWIQPVGATDAYPIGAKVSHNEKHWVSIYDNNIWEPGVFGWDEISS